VVHYEIAGSGDPLVLLHGIGSNSKSWRRQLQAFSGAFTVVAWDAPGFGRSPDPKSALPSMTEYTEALEELLESLGFGSAIVLGHSMGGLVAQEFYRAFPQSVQALILADTTRGGGDPTNRLQMIQSMTPRELALARAPKLLSKQAAPELIEEAITIMSEVRRTGYEFAAVSMSKADTRGVLDTIDVPLLMIWGAADEITPPWSRWPAKAQVQIIPSAGHLCYAEQPDRFNAIVLDFLQGLTCRTTGLP